MEKGSLDDVLRVRIAKEDKEILKERAKKMRMSLSQYVIYILFNNEK